MTLSYPLQSAPFTRHANCSSSREHNGQGAMEDTDYIKE